MQNNLYGKDYAVSKFYGLQFYRQKPILHFIGDFYYSAANLVIECNGGQHYTDESLEVD